MRNGWYSDVAYLPDKFAREMRQVLDELERVQPAVEQFYQSKTEPKERPR